MSREERIERAKNALKAEVSLDRVLDIYVDYDYVEFTGKIGTDTVTFRVYNGGTITER